MSHGQDRNHSRLRNPGRIAWPIPLRSKPRSEPEPSWSALRRRSPTARDSFLTDLDPRRLRGPRRRQAADAATVRARRRPRERPGPAYRPVVRHQRQHGCRYQDVAVGGDQVPQHDELRPRHDARRFRHGSPRRPSSASRISRASSSASARASRKASLPCMTRSASTSMARPT